MTEIETPVDVSDDPAFCAGKCELEVKACDETEEHVPHDYEGEPMKFYHCRAGRKATRRKRNA